MSPSGQKLSLDEQSFQDLLAAAFTIQEHNAKVKRPVGAQRFCGQCGAPLLPGESRCTMCSADTDGFRSGERMQKNWASLWDLQQQQEASEEGTPEQPERNEPRPAQVATSKLGQVDGDSSEETTTASESPANGSVHGGRRFPAPPAAAVHFPHYYEEPLEDEAADAHGSPVEVAGPNETMLPADYERHLVTFPTSPTDSMDDKVTQEAAQHDEAVEIETIAGLTEGESNGKPRKLVLNRADIYLAMAIGVAVIVLFWVMFGNPASAGTARAGAQHRVQLSLWERALVNLGLAEAPEEPVYRGDPSVQVWVDTHTALYYCLGSEQYGKTPNGHYSTQRDAQRDWFEPAERSVCE